MDCKLRGPPNPHPDQPRDEWTLDVAFLGPVGVRPPFLSYFYGVSARSGRRIDEKRAMREEKTMAGGGGGLGDIEHNVKQLEDCSVSNALGTWFFSVAGALIAIPVGIEKKSLAPLVFFGTTGTMLEIIMGISQRERDHAERQMKLLEAQNLTANASAETEIYS